MTEVTENGGVEVSVEEVGVALDIALVRATIHLPGGIQPGTEYWVDRSSPYVARALDGGYLVEVDQKETAEQAVVDEQ